MAMSKGKTVIKECKLCGEKFGARVSRAGTAKFCSKEHYWEYRKEYRWHRGEAIKAVHAAARRDSKRTGENTSGPVEGATAAKKVHSLNHLFDNQELLDETPAGMTAKDYWQMTDLGSSLEGVSTVSVQHLPASSSLSALGVGGSDVEWDEKLGGDSTLGRGEVATDQSSLPNLFSGMNAGSPSARLLLAILERAIRDVAYGSDWQRESALEWFLRTEEEYTGYDNGVTGFLSICSYFGFDSETILEGVCQEPEKVRASFEIPDTSPQSRTATGRRYGVFNGGSSRASR